METTGAQANGHVEHVQVSPNSDGTAENEKSSAGLHAHTSDQSSGETGRMANALKVKKRTKTGCLTCRRRRIKCGEERPTCRNCSKSKRECEGYVPRVVFKDPVQAIQNGIDGLQEIPYGLQSYEGVGAGFGGMNPMSAYGISLIPLAPRPTTYDEYAPYLHTSRVVAPYASAVITPESNQFTLHQDSNAFHPGQQPPGHFTSSHCDLGLERPSAVADTQSDLYLDLEPSRTRTDDFAMKPKVASSSWLRTDVSPPTPTSQYPTPLTGSTSDESTLFSPFTWPHPTIIPEAPAPAIAGSDDRLPAKHWHKPPNVPDSVPSPTPEDEDDPYDIDSDEDDTKMSAPSGDCQASDLSLMIRVAAHQNNSNMRSISNFLNEPNVLATYQPSYFTSPLMDPQTARVFCHFITATGPMLNVCERHPSNPSVIFQGRPVPQFQRALWSYKLPMLALQHSCLLHAMLAIASLHIANLQRTSPTPSLKHYHFALRRVAKALRKPDRRRNVSTLAATLLLGYYEVTTAEHNKWNSHLAGARELIVEVDFATAARKVEAYKTQQEIAEMHIPRFGFDGLDGYAKLTGYDLPVKASRRLDQNLLSTIMGWAMDFNHYERIDEPLLPATYSINSQDVETAEIQCDLYWWYAKQDVYQSIISGNRLLLSYDRWGQCPPRTPMGRQDAPYGSMDHLLLLMGRLADFASKDLPRKRRQVQAQAATTTTPSPTSANGMPPMYGMMPDPGPVVVPRGFDQGQQDRIYAIPVPSADKSLEAATADAQAEHAAIAYAFDVFFDALGPSFAPLSPEHMTPTTTPFGPAIYYRSYPIACLLTLYNCGRIILARTAPHMPPAAMAAAGVAAHATAVYANTIGRICAGIQPVSNTAPLNPHHGAALMDVCMGLFHAGVQYRDAAQRGWTISKLRDVARLTGWQSSALIASGCERAWARAAEMGKGPPYQRTVTSEFKDARMTGRTKDPRMSSVAPKSNNDRSFVRQNAGTRVYWAMGILSMEEDMREMNLGHDER